VWITDRRPALPSATRGGRAGPRPRSSARTEGLLDERAVQRVGLKPGDALTSQNGRYRLELQSDGNLVLTAPTGLAWDSDTRGKGTATAELQTDGNFVLYTQRGDTLSAIAKRFYGHAGEYRRIAAANNIANPDLIHPGQQPVIPA
jgi:LysM repeat protein